MSASLSPCHGAAPVKVQRGKTFLISCPTCGRKAEGDTPDSAAALWESLNRAASPGAGPTLDNPESLPGYIAAHAAEIVAIAAPFVKSDRPAFDLMVKKSVRYVLGLSGDAWAKVWATPEGRESIVAALEEAFMLGATLPDMGCFVPYGGVAEFIPDVEAYRFAVTTGGNAPFLDLQIEPVYERDEVAISRKDGNFAIEFGRIWPDRGQVCAVAVYGRARNGTIPGELYPVDRLLAKAQGHSQSYQNYLRDLQAFEAAKAEGRVQTVEGRAYCIRTIPKRDGTTWEKKIYLDEITNPYDGPDRPEMLRKLAGKSFLSPWIKTRNSTAAVSELDKTDDVSILLDQALGAALDAVPGDDARPVEPTHEADKAEEEPVAQPAPAECPALPEKTAEAMPAPIPAAKSRGEKVPVKAKAPEKPADAVAPSGEADLF